MLPSKVLVVDDDPDVRASTVEVLEEEGVSVAQVSDGKQALEWLRLHPALSATIVLDLAMPIMDGEMFLTAKQADPAIAGLPVIMASADDRCDEVARAFNVRCCLRKPVASDRLLGALRESCRCG